MRICILGFDGLEWTTASKTPGLTQAECRKVRNDIPPIKFVDATTPSYWATIITGEYPDVHGVMHYGSWDKSYLKCKCWFDLIPGSVPIQVPTYNCTDPPTGEISKVMGVPERMKKFAEWQLGRMEGRASKTLEALKDKPPLVMTHFYATDLIGHLYAWNKERMNELYEKCAGIVKRVNSEIGEEGCVLVMSDHGMYEKRSGHGSFKMLRDAYRGDHTPYAFFSSSIPLGLPESPHLTDIFPLVMELVKMPTPAEMEKLKERLRKLGYFG